MPNQAFVSSRLKDENYGKLLFPLKIYLGNKRYSVFHVDELE